MGPDWSRVETVRSELEDSQVHLEPSDVGACNQSPMAERGHALYDDQQPARDFDKDNRITGAAKSVHRFISLIQLTIPETDQKPEKRRKNTASFKDSRSNQHYVSGSI